MSLKSEMRETNKKNRCEKGEKEVTRKGKKDAVGLCENL